jgi:hypothetical protein
MQGRLTSMGIPPAFPENDPSRAVFCNRTINLRAVRAVGFDMDYTLIQYDVAAWEGKAYAHGVPCCPYSIPCMDCGRNPCHTQPL